MIDCSDNTNDVADSRSTDWDCGDCRYLAAAVTVVGATVWGWNVNLVILLSLLVVASTGLCAMRALWHSRWRDKRSEPPNNRFCFSGGHRTPRLDD